MPTIQALINEDSPYTVFPTAVDTIDRKADIDLTTKPLTDEYYSYYNRNDFENMVKLLENHPELKKVISTSEDWNKLRDGLIGVQRFFLERIDDYLINFSKPKGGWDKNTKYEKYNVVTYKTNNAIQTYIANPSNPYDFNIPIGTLPTDTNYWICITLRGEKGESGTGMTPRGMYEPGVRYYKNDLVAYNNAFWFAVLDNLDQTPNPSSASWQVMMTFSSALLIFDNSTTNLIATTVHDAIVELSRKMKCIKDVTIPAGGFVNNIYTYNNNAISASYEPRVNFTEESLAYAQKANVVVHTYDGYMTFKVRKIPPVDLKIETIMLTATF